MDAWLSTIASPRTSHECIFCPSYSWLVLNLYAMIFICKLA